MATIIKCKYCGNEFEKNGRRLFCGKPCKKGFDYISAQAANARRARARKLNA